jgi:hypothetical protein
MPTLDTNTMSWLTGVFAPLLAALVAASVGAGAAIYATRWEAERAERRENRKALQLERERLVETTHAELVKWLYDAANSVVPEDQRLLRSSPRAFNMTLMTSESLLKVRNFTDEFSAREQYSGFSVEDGEKLSDVLTDLDRDAQRQLDRVKAGLEPEIHDPSPELIATVSAYLDSLRTKP